LAASYVLIPVSEEFQKKVLLLVSLPYGRSYEAMKKAMFEPTPETSLVDWDSNDKTHLPPLQSLATSIRHFAICLGPLGAWDDPTKSLIQKFQHGTYWELIGPNMILR